MPMTTATLDPGTTTTPWWEDSRNVTLLARWYMDVVNYGENEGFSFSPGGVAVQMFEIFENPAGEIAAEVWQDYRILTDLLGQ